MLRPDPGRKAFLKETATRYRLSLPGSPAEDHLNSRGLQAAFNFGLGYVADPVKGHEQYQGMLAIPYYRYNKQVVQIRFKCLVLGCPHDGHGKYNTVEGESGVNLYNTLTLLYSTADTVVVCEGELDAVASELAGVKTIGVPGANGWKPYHSLLLDGYPNVIIVGDGDDAGKTFTKLVKKTTPQGRRVVMPSGHDVNSFIQEYGTDEYKELIGYVE